MPDFRWLWRLFTLVGHRVERPRGCVRRHPEFSGRGSIAWSRGGIWSWRTPGELSMVRGEDRRCADPGCSAPLGGDSGGGMGGYFGGCLSDRSRQDLRILAALDCFRDRWRRDCGWHRSSDVLVFAAPTEQRAPRITLTPTRLCQALPTEESELSRTSYM